MRRFRRTTLIGIFCLAVLAGLGLSRKIDFEPHIWWLAFSPILLLLRHRNITALLLVLTIGLGFGLWRGSVYMQKLDELKSLTKQKVIVEVTAKTDAIYAKKSQLEFTANKIQLIDPQQKPLSGTFKISGFGLPMVYRGDRLRVEGKLFPTRGANQATIAYAKLERLGLDTSWFNSLIRQFKAGIQNALPEPLSSFGLGLLVGQRSTMPQEVMSQLTIVGLVHIVAVSGYNVTILARAVARLKIVSKYQRLVLSLALIGAFILITGFSASIVRAGLIALLSLWAWYYGLNFRPTALIAFVAALTGFISPFYVWSDLGWYLSFLAFFGVLVIAPLVANRFFKRSPRGLAMIVIETLSAEVMTLPLIAMTFGQLSLVALVANAIVVPLVPLAMLLSAIAAAAGTWLTEIAGWLAWPANILLTFILDVVHLLAGVPSAMVHRTISSAMMLGFYGLVLLMLLATHHHLRNKAAQTVLEKRENPRTA